MNVELIRKVASRDNGQRYLEERFAEKQICPYAVINLQKAASADVELLKIAAWLEGDALENYELLGGQQ
jgi:hypothetical protein